MSAPTPARRDARRRTDADDMKVPDAVGAEGIEHLVVGQDRVRAMLAELPPRERDVLASMEV